MFSLQHGVISSSHEMKIEQRCKFCCHHSHLSHSFMFLWYNIQLCRVTQKCSSKEGKDKLIIRVLEKQTCDRTRIPIVVIAFQETGMYSFGKHERNRSRHAGKRLHSRVTPHLPGPVHTKRILNSAKTLCHGTLPNLTRVLL